MCGHVGRKSYIPITFAIKAENGREAAKIARSIPRVKHDNKFAILGVVKVSYEEYLAQKEDNRRDPYLNWRTDKYDSNYDLIKILERVVQMNNKKENKVEEPVRTKKKTPRRESMKIRKHISEEMCLWSA